MSKLHILTKGKDYFGRYPITEIYANMIIYDLNISVNDMVMILYPAKKEVLIYTITKISSVYNDITEYKSQSSRITECSGNWIRKYDDPINGMLIDYPQFYDQVKAKL